ncbi:MAG: helix-turn-helix transcriptional regulator [Armatimonadota bacterium]
MRETRFDIVRFAQSVKKARGDRGLRSFAGGSGVSTATISRIETGKSPDIETFLKLCDYIGESPGSFLGENSYPDTIPARERGMLQHISDSIAKRQYWNALSWAHLLTGELLRKQQEIDR